MTKEELSEKVKEISTKIREIDFQIANLSDTQIALIDEKRLIDSQLFTAILMEKDLKKPRAVMANGEELVIDRVTFSSIYLRKPGDPKDLRYSRDGIPENKKSPTIKNLAEVIDIADRMKQR